MTTGSLRLTPGIILIALFTLTAVPAVAKGYPEAVPGEFMIETFAFDDGSVQPLWQHYRTLGTPHRGTDGKASNAVLIMHGTTGNGAGFLSENFAGVLFGKGSSWIPRNTSLFCPTPLAMANPASPVMVSAPNSRPIPTTTWCAPNTGC